VALHGGEAGLDAVIPVKPQPAPPEFDAKVRQPGQRWLQDAGLPVSGSVPEGIQLRPYWRECFDELHRAYGGICAYVSVYIDRVAGTPTVEHFVAKSAALEAAYEWSNYRLACAKMNSRKRAFDDVLDPFELAEGTFVLELVSMKIAPNPALSPPDRERAQATIDRLGLDDAECRRVRAEYFDEHRAGHIDEDYLRRKCPFVWHEIQRQGALYQGAAILPP
jgi:uncharacterized protein (TIGR02646 family)